MVVFAVAGGCYVLLILWLIFSESTDDKETPCKEKQKKSQNCFPAYLVPKGYWVEREDINCAYLMSEGGGRIVYNYSDKDGWTTTSFFRGVEQKNIKPKHLYSDATTPTSTQTETPTPSKNVEKIKNPDNTMVGEDGKTYVKPFYSLKAKEWVLGNITSIGKFVQENKESEAVFNENLPTDKEELEAIAKFLNLSEDCGELYENVTVIADGLLFKFVN